MDSSSTSSTPSPQPHAPQPHAHQPHAHQPHQHQSRRHINTSLAATRLRSASGSASASASKTFKGGINDQPSTGGSGGQWGRVRPGFRAPSVECSMIRGGPSRRSTRLSTSGPRTPEAGRCTRYGT
ncbi:hypothetical protein AB1N83_008398 [Pleurotus pulmonarius]